MQLTARYRLRILAGKKEVGIGFWQSKHVALRPQKRDGLLGTGEISQTGSWGSGGQPSVYIHSEPFAATVQERTVPESEIKHRKLP